jgi:hypothetical protein
VREGGEEAATNFDRLNSTQFVKSALAAHRGDVPLVHALYNGKSALTP